MKSKRSQLVVLSCIIALANFSVCALNIPSDGSDGIFAPPTNIVVDLAQAVTGTWDDDNTANSGKGIYDPSKWAIIFKYQSVDIPAGALVTFLNHPSRAPVVWLIQSNAVIDGVVSLNGQPGSDDSFYKTFPVEPGPGGYRGGASSVIGNGVGLGPAGGGHAGYLGIYGNPQILPLIGGSGGGGINSAASGEGGSGAILIAAASNLTLNGTVKANSSLSPLSIYRASGGAIKIITETLLGTGTIEALGYPGVSGNGRIRIEANSISQNILSSPETIAVPPADPPIIWPADNAPSVRIASVSGINSPADPTAPLVNQADIAIATNGAVAVVVETKNFPVSGLVQLRYAYKYGDAYWVSVPYQGGTFTQATWSVDLTLNGGFSTLQARATVP